MPFYPVNLKIQDRFCLIVGGGKVAARKIEPLLVCGARVRVISPMACGRIRDLHESGKIEWLRRGFQPGDLDGAFLVFAATDNREVQEQVLEEARTLGLLVNRVDAPEACTFQVPATVRQGGLLLSVSTEGGSPALSAWIRKRLTGEYGFEYGVVLDLLASIRSEIVGDGKTPGSHRLLFERILEMDVLTCIRHRDWPALEAQLALILPKTIDIAGLVAEISAKDRPGDELKQARGAQDG